MAKITTPERLQRSRQYKPGIPPGSIYVGRPSQWGNPAKIGKWYFSKYGQHAPGYGSVFVETRYFAVHLFYQYAKDYFQHDPDGFFKWIMSLAGRSVCCWCPNGEICHGDVLIYLAGLIKDGSFQKPDRWPDLSEITTQKAPT